MNAAARTPAKTSTPAANDAIGASATLTYEQAYALGQKFHLSSHSVQALAREIDALLNPPEPAGEPFVVTGSGAALMPAGLPLAQEPKYTTNGRSIINRATGEAIPDDEPVFIMRARDRNALFGMIEYARRCADPDHVAAVDKRISDFAQFAALYPHRIKHPDTATPLTWSYRALDRLTRDLADRRAFVFGDSAAPAADEQKGQS